MFIHIPKNAGYSISRWLINNFTGKYLDTGCIHPSTSMIKQKFEESFAVVRNPWDRTVSLWAFWNKIKKTEITFDYFVRNLHTFKFNEISWFTLDKPQKTWIPEGVTYLLKFETLEDDFKIIQNRLGCHDPLLKINQSQHDDYKSYYTSETWNMVSEIFREDIESFGYDEINYFHVVDGCRL